MTNKPFICPKYISEAWIERFRTLEFTIDNEDYLYSPKTYNESWDAYTRALWLRSIGMKPERISEKLDIEIYYLKNHIIDKITKHYNLRPALGSDWSTMGYVNISHNRIVKFGGISSHSASQAVSPYQLQNEQQLDMDAAIHIMRKRINKVSAEGR